MIFGNPISPAYMLDLLESARPMIARAIPSLSDQELHRLCEAAQALGAAAREERARRALPQ